MKKINVLIADKQPVFVAGLAFFLEQRDNVEKVFSVDNSKTLLNTLTTNTIDVIVTDVVLWDCNTIQFIDDLLKYNRFSGGVVFITDKDISVYSEIIANVGGRACLSKMDAGDVIVDAIFAASKGYTLFKKEFVLKQSNKLSSREQIVLDYLIQGYSNRKIASVMSLSEKTISTYKRRVLRKLRVQSLIDIVTCANSGLNL